MGGLVITVFDDIQLSEEKNRRNVRFTCMIPKSLGIPTVHSMMSEAFHREAFQVMRSTTERIFNNLSSVIQPADNRCLVAKIDH